ncbi:MAG: 50S ribosomal protein L13 [Candidatus Pacearchaeota archaeon]
MERIIVDGKNAVLGRLASYAAKQSLLGREVIILNSEDVVIIGNKKDILNKYLSLIKKGGSSLKGPKIPRTPERILKRTIRGMLPHKKGRGEKSIDNIKCYNNIPEEFKDSKKITAGRVKTGKFMKLSELVSLIK